MTTITDTKILDLLGVHDALTVRVALDLTEGVRALGLDLEAALGVQDDRLAIILTTPDGSWFTVTARSFGNIDALTVTDHSGPSGITDRRIEARPDDRDALHDAVVEALEVISEAMGS